MESPQQAGNSTGNGTYSPSMNRLSTPSILGPAGSYGGAFTITNPQNGAALLNGANSKLKKSAEHSLARSAWSGGADSFSNHGATAWTAGATAFGSKSSSWAAGAGSFGMPVQAGGVWRSAPPSGLPSASPVGMSKAAALAAGAIPPISSLGTGSLPGTSSFARSGLAANGRQHTPSSRKPSGGLGSSLPAGVQSPFARSQQSAGAFGRSGSQTSGFGGRETGAGTSRGLGASHQSGSEAPSDPFSRARLIQPVSSMVARGLTQMGRNIEQ